MRSGLLVVLLGSLCAVPARSQEPPAEPAPRTPTPVPTPADGIALLQPFEGRWTCEGEVPGTLLSRAHKTRSTVTVRKDLDGFWWAGRSVQEKTADNPQPVTRLFFWSWDTTLGELVGGWLDSRGGWSAQTSILGVKDGRLEWAGHVTLIGSKVIAREIYTMPAGGTFTRRFEVLDMDGLTWIRGTDETCRNADAPPPPPRPDPAR